MPEFKRQHYVPRCYLKPFSFDGEGAAINLYNITGSRVVRNGSIKGQCARDYLYGEDGKLERQLKNFEDEYARVLRVLCDETSSIATRDVIFIREFAFLQYARTEMAMKRMRMMREGMHNATYEGHPIERPDLDLSDRAMMLDSMKMYSNAHQNIEDLNVCIVTNKTNLDFITSDDPAIFTSRLHIQRFRQNIFGLGSSGAVFFLPLTPRLLMMSYDSDVYAVQGRAGHFVSIHNRRDVLALNELQYIKAAENVYFSNWDARNLVVQGFNEVSDQRPEAWCRINVFVPDGVTETRERHRPATDEERQTATHRTIMISNLHPAPSRWLSKLRFRQRIRTYSNGSAAGHVRKSIWESRFLDSP